MSEARDFVRVTASREPVLIWSGEHRAWWRPNSRGHTVCISAAGRYGLAEALAITRHCGSEKRIVIVDDFLPLKKFEPWP
jgi:hypothetical protein